MENSSFMVHKYKQEFKEKKCRKQWESDWPYVIMSEGKNDRKDSVV